MTINLPKDVDPDRHIIDFDLGIVNQLEIKGGTLFDDRFGSKLAQSELEEGSKLEIVCEPIGPGEISVTNEELRKSVRLACQVFVPSAFGHLLPKEKIRARFSHRFVECIVSLFGKQREVSLNMKFPEPNDRVLIRELHGLSALVLLIGEANERSNKITLSTKLNNERVGSGEIKIDQKLSPTAIKWANLVERAWTIARYFEMDSDLSLSAHDLSQHEGPMLTMSGFLDYQRRDFKLTFWTHESSSLQGMECCIPVVAMTNLGEKIVGMAAGLIGTINLTGEKKEDEIQCEVVTNDVRIVDQYVGDDAVEALAESEGMKERVIEKYKDMDIIELDL